MSKPGSSTQEAQIKPNGAAQAEPKGWLGLAFIVPGFLFIFALFLVPLAMTIWMSFYNWPLLGRRKFTGLDNYVELLGDPQLFSSLGFTLLYTVLVTAAIFAVAFPLALLVDRPLRSACLLYTSPSPRD